MLSPHSVGKRLMGSGFINLCQLQLSKVLRQLPSICHLLLQTCWFERSLSYAKSTVFASC